MNPPHKKREPFPGQGERRTEFHLKAKLRRCDDVMIIIPNANNNVVFWCGYSDLIWQSVVCQHQSIYAQLFKAIPHINRSVILLEKKKILKMAVQCFQQKSNKMTSAPSMRTHLTLHAVSREKSRREWIHSLYWKKKSCKLNLPPSKLEHKRRRTRWKQLWVHQIAHSNAVNC